MKEKVPSNVSEAYYHTYKNKGAIKARPDFGLSWFGLVSQRWYDRMENRAIFLLCL